MRGTHALQSAATFYSTRLQTQPRAPKLVSHTGSDAATCFRMVMVMVVMMMVVMMMVMVMVMMMMMMMKMMMVVMVARSL